MDNSDFYIAAATVIPLLLIAIMAARSFRPGDLQQQPVSTVLLFGLPIIGEIAAFSFLFFAPVPTAAAAVLAIVTWAGLLSQLAFAVLWLGELIRDDSPSETESASDADENPSMTETGARLKRSRGVWVCAACETVNSAEASTCIACRGPRSR